MIKNIIFDMSEVIISGYHGIEKILENKKNIPTEVFKKRKEETLDVFLDTMRGKYTENEYIDCLLNGTDWNITKDEFKEIIRENLNIPVPGTMEIVHKLSNKYNLILLSDYVREWREYIKQYNSDLNIFKKQFFSFETGMLKKDDGYFKYILNESNINQNETIFIDDYKSNVQKAQECDINGIVFTNAKDLEKELHKKYNINL